MEWRSVVGYESSYEVSSDGQVRSLERVIIIGGKKRKIKSSLLKPQLRGEYLSVHLSDNGIVKHKSIHRLVAESFLENKLNKPVINHIDGNKLNNDLLNLEWVTSSENLIHAIKLGLKTITDKHLMKSKLNFEKHRETQRIIVLDTCTGIYYNSVNDACFASGIPKTTLKRYLDNSSHKTNLRYA